MPRYLILFAVLLLAHVGQAQHLPPQPFERFGYHVEILTLSKGKYQEFFPNDSLRKVGSVVYNRRLRKIARLLPLDTLRHHAPDITSRWLSVDPLADKYPDMTPYAFGANNPVRFMDPDGRSGWDVVAGAAIATLGNLGGPDVRTAYTPDDASDYDNALTAADATAVAAGALLMTSGGADIGTGAAGLVVAGGLEAATVGAATPVAVPLAGASATLMGVGAVKLGMGAVLYANGSKNLGSAQSNSRAGKDFMPKGKEQVVRENSQRNGGKVLCEGCKTETTKPGKSQRGVTPPRTDRQVDHKVPKSKGGAGEPSNGQVLCRTCNRAKSDK